METVCSASGCAVVVGQQCNRPTVGIGRRSAQWDRCCAGSIFSSQLLLTLLDLLDATKIPKTLLTNFVDDVLIVEETAATLVIVHWDGVRFVTRRLSVPGASSLEHVSFAPIDSGEIGANCEIGAVKLGPEGREIGAGSIHYTFYETALPSYEWATWPDCREWNGLHVGITSWRCGRSVAILSAMTGTSAISWSCWKKRRAGLLCSEGGTIGKSRSPR